MRKIAPGEVLQANAASLDHQPIEFWQYNEGSPTTSISNLGSVAGAQFGLWEMSPGSVLDVESDEVFIVVTGEGTLEFLEPKLPTIQLFAGSIVRLGDGMKTKWTIHQGPLRKLYLTAEGASDDAPRPNDYSTNRKQEL